MARSFYQFIVLICSHIFFTYHILLTAHSPFRPINDFKTNQNTQEVKNERFLIAVISVFDYFFSPLCSQVVNLAINIMLISDGEFRRSVTTSRGFSPLGGLIYLSPAPILQVGVTAASTHHAGRPAALAPTVGYVLEVGLAGPSGTEATCAALTRTFYPRGSRIVVRSRSDIESHTGVALE